MKSILKLKHWQVFLILYAIYFAGLTLWQRDFSIGEFSALQISVFTSLITIILFFLWLLNCGLFVNNAPSNPYKFRSGLLIFAILCSIIGYAEINLERLAEEGMIFPEWISFLFVPMTLIAIFYIFYIIPKSLKSIELNREAKFMELIPDALLLFVFPIGVWFIQPRLAKILDKMRGNNTFGINQKL